MRDLSVSLRAPETTKRYRPWQEATRAIQDGARPKPSGARRRGSSAKRSSGRWPDDAGTGRSDWGSSSSRSPSPWSRSSSPRVAATPPRPASHLRKRSSPRRRRPKTPRVATRCRRRPTTRTRRAPTLRSTTSTSAPRADLTTPPKLSTYPTTPPASGPHDPTPLPAGIYDSPPDVYRTIHSLEHGAVIIWYAPGTTGKALDDLKAFYGQPASDADVGQAKIIIAPYDYPDQGDAGQLPAGVQMALVAWHRLQTCASVSLPVAFDFSSQFEVPGYGGQHLQGRRARADHADLAAWRTGRSANRAVPRPALRRRRHQVGRAPSDGNARSWPGRRGRRSASAPSDRRGCGGWARSR